MSKRSRIEPSGAVVARIADTALALPDAYEEDAWTGVRWRVRTKTFAHVAVSQEGYLSSYRDLTGVTRATTVLTFRSAGEELYALTHMGPPFYKPPWSPTVVGVVLDDGTDWDEVAELVIESYRYCAPAKLARQLDQRRHAVPPQVQGLRSAGRHIRDAGRPLRDLSHLRRVDRPLRSMSERSLLRPQFDVGVTTSPVIVHTSDSSVLTSAMFSMCSRPAAESR